jgi:hypothetical protein
MLGEEIDMSKRSKVPEIELKRLTRQLMMLELKFQFANEDKAVVQMDIILKKATRLSERIVNLKASIGHARKMDEIEAHEINNKMNEEKANADSNPDNRPDN